MRRGRSLSVGVYCVAFAAAVLVAGPGVARADGLPVLGIDVGNSGVTTSDGARYVTMASGGSTVVARLAQTGGGVLLWRAFPGTFTIPAVAYDGSAGGLSADGKTLALIEPRQSFPRAQTRFLILGRGLALRGLVKLKGDFSFDAISPHGDWLFLIHYTSPQDPTRYLVQAYDLRRRRLVPAPIIDPTAPGEKMRGNPVTRTMSADGRWAYTLYDGGGASCTHSTPLHGPHIASTSTRCHQAPICRSCGLPWLGEASSSRSEAAVKARSTLICAHSGSVAPVVVCSARSSERGSCSSPDLPCSWERCW